MKTFLGDDFLLNSDIAIELYQRHAKPLPIIDYHCHLDPRQVAEDHHFATITELWLSGDHYKWRAMRANGIAEDYITGAATDKEKFLAWARTVPYCMRNPLYHWTHLELKTAFGIDTILNETTAEDIYERCNALLHTEAYSAQGLLKRYNVELLCTTDDPVDSLEHHLKMRESGCGTRMLPTWRPDKAMATTDTAAYRGYIECLSQVSGITISGYHDLVDALVCRHEFFDSVGCRLSDHGLTQFVAEEYTESDMCRLFDKVYGGTALTPRETALFTSGMLILFAEMDCDSGWTQQFHYGAQRNNNSRMYRLIGADTGFDSIGEYATAQEMAMFFDRLDSRGKLTQTIIYNLNPAANEMVATMIGNFQDGSVPGKMQMGSGWWFLDQKDGIQRQLQALSSQGLLSRFVGMLTDSRSFLSYPRHEYFRRILCDTIGRDLVNGELPTTELPRIQQMVEDIAYYNAKHYFHF